MLSFNEHKMTNNNILTSCKVLETVSPNLSALIFNLSLSALATGF